MDLPHDQKVLLGIATVWPPVYFLFFIAAVGSTIAAGLVNPLAVAGLPLLVGILIPMHFLVIIEMIALTWVYIYLVIRKLDVPDNDRLLWVTAVVLGSLIGQLIFFFIHVWPSSSEAPGSSDSPPVVSQG